MADWLYRLQHIGVWIRRFGYANGFGVQSPWAYRFVTEVVNKKHPAAAYDALRAAWKSLSRKERKLAELYFRLSGYARAAQWRVWGKAGAHLGAYIGAGFAGSEVCACGAVEQLLSGEGSAAPCVYLLLSADISIEQVDDLLASATSSSILILQDIQQSKAHRMLWRRIIENDKVAVSFDLYDCGIAFFNKNLHKRNYILYF